MKLAKKLMTLGLVGVIGMTALTGCGKKEASTEGGDTSKEITVGYYNCDHMTAAPVAEAAGIYKELGLNVKTVGNGKVPEAMAAGQMDAGYIGTRGLCGAIPKGSPIVVGANNHKGGSEFLIMSNKYSDPKELIGKKIATDMSDFLWQSDYGPETGLPVDASKYELINMDSSKDAYLAMKTGKIDAFTACDPWGSVAEFEGTGKIVASTQYKEKDGTEYNCCSFSLNTNFVKENPELAEKLMLAHTKAIEYIYTHPAQAAKIFAEYYDVDEEVGMMTIYKKTVGEGRTLTWDIGDGTAYKNNLKMYKDLKALEEIPSYEEVVDDSILKSCGADDFDTFIKEKVDPVFPQGMDYETWKEKALSIKE